MAHIRKRHTRLRKASALIGLVQARDLVIFTLSVRMCLLNLVIAWGNYLIIEVAEIPLYIGGHPEHWMLDVLINIYN